MQLSDRQQGYLGLLMGMGAGSFAAVIVRMTQGAGMGSIAIAAGRLGIAALLLMPFALRTSMPEMRALNGRQWRLILVAGMLMAGHFATFISALEYTSVLSTVVFSATAPFFAAFIGWLARGRRPASAIWIGIGLAMVGTVLVAAGGDTGNPPTRSDPLLGNTLALCGAFSHQCIPECRPGSA
jgi:drug/metabolite transporter (DMT)-like permease